MLSTIIAKPSRSCNADCAYCSSPPTGAEQWSPGDFIAMLRNLSPLISKESKTLVIWHGGEPLLLGQEFFLSCFDLAKAEFPTVRHSLQTNLIKFDETWLPVLKKVFNGVLSTSFEPGGSNRTLNGNSELYSKLFVEKLRLAEALGVKCAVTGVYFHDTITTAVSLYEFARTFSNIHSIRVNTGLSLGRAKNSKLVQPTPDESITMYLDLLDRWTTDAPAFVIQPFADMIQLILTRDHERCPWTSTCFSKIVGIEPDFSIYTCSDMADLEPEKFAYGNIRTTGILELFSAPKSATISRDCKSNQSYCGACDFFQICNGGCRVVSLSSAFQGKCVWKAVFAAVLGKLRAGKLDWYLDLYAKKGKYVPET